MREKRAPEEQTEQNAGFTVDQIKKLAYVGKELPPVSIPPPERILWYAFRDLYQRYKTKAISKEESEKESAAIMRAYRDDKGIFEQTMTIWKYHAELWRDIELAGSAFAKERTIETAERFYEAVYGVRMKQKAEQVEQTEQKDNGEQTEQAAEDAGTEGE